MTFLLGRWLRSRPSNPNTPTTSDPPTVPPIKIDEFHKHEVIDRSSVIRDTWATHVMEHIVVVSDKQLKAQAQKAFDEIEAFYQLCGETFR